MSFFPAYYVIHPHCIYIEDAICRVQTLILFWSMDLTRTRRVVQFRILAKIWGRVNRKLADVRRSSKFGLHGLGDKKYGSEKNWVYLGVLLNCYQDANLRFSDLEGILSLGLELPDIIYKKFSGTGSNEFVCFFLQALRFLQGPSDREAEKLLLLRFGPYTRPLVWASTGTQDEI